MYPDNQNCIFKLTFGDFYYFLSHNVIGGFRRIYTTFRRSATDVYNEKLMRYMFLGHCRSFNSLLKTPIDMNSELLETTLQTI